MSVAWSMLFGTPPPPSVKDLVYTATKIRMNSSSTVQISTCDLQHQYDYNYIFSIQYTVTNALSK